MSSPHSTAASKHEGESQFGNPTHSSSFIEAVRVEHGPVPLLGRFFLDVDRYVRECGISLRFASFQEFAEVNSANLSTWSPLMPLLDYRECKITAEDGLCVLGEDKDGTVVTAQAARLIDLGDRSLRESADVVEFFYPDKQDRTDYRARLSAASADDITGRIVYSGGTWVRPDYRGRGMASMLPRVSRAVAATRWNAPITISFVTADLIARGVPKAYGYTNVEWGLELRHRDELIYEGALVWMHRSELFRDMAYFLDMSSAKINPRIWDRAGDNQRRLA